MISTLKIAELSSYKRILITGGAGFIGSNLIRFLLSDTYIKVFNIDNLNYAGNFETLSDFDLNQRHIHLNINLSDRDSTIKAVERANPDLIIHLAAESHVDRSIESPANFIQSNIVGTFNLLEAALLHWENIPNNLRRNKFRFHHVSTDEVFGSLGAEGSFNEKTAYSPRSPYSASKASSDHLVNAWHHTYKLPTIITNCSNNYGPYQFPEKLIPLVITKAVKQKKIPVYGDGLNIRDWLFVEDHIRAILIAAVKGKIGETYCIGGYQEKTNLEVVEKICFLMDKLKPIQYPYSNLIEHVDDRPGHDRRYAINASKIKKELGWNPKYDFNSGMNITVNWYLSNLEWCQRVLNISGYDGGRLGT